MSRTTELEDQRGLNQKYEQPNKTFLVGQESESNFLNLAFEDFSFIKLIIAPGESNPYYDFELVLDEESEIADLIGAEPIFISCKSSACGVRAGMASLSDAQAIECEFDPQRVVVINTKKKLTVELIYAQIVNYLVRFAQFCSDTNEQDLLAILDQTDPQLSYAYRKYKKHLTFLPSLLPVETTLGEAKTESGKEPEAVDFAHLARLVEEYFPGVSVQPDPYAIQQPPLIPCLQKLKVEFDNGLGENMIRPAQWFLFFDGRPGSSKGRPTDGIIPYYVAIVSSGYTDEMLVAEFLAQLITFHGMGEQLLYIIINPEITPRSNLKQFIETYKLQAAWQILLANHFCLDQYRTPWIQRIAAQLRLASREDARKATKKNHEQAHHERKERQKTGLRPPQAKRF